MPAKSGVGGCVFVVIPNVCGISIWSPRLDAVGNSTRGVHAATELVKHFAFHNFEVFSGKCPVLSHSLLPHAVSFDDAFPWLCAHNQDSLLFFVDPFLRTAGLSQNKIDPTQPKNQAKHRMLGELLFAASQGDAAALTSQLHAGVDVFATDYDQRSALHLAASDGHSAAVRVLVDAALEANRAAALSAADRWGGTPLSDAEHCGFEDCAAILREAGATAGTPVCYHSNTAADDVTIADSAPEVLFAASEGDLDELIKLVAKGVDVTICDYDRRSALHLAASNGHAHIIKYLLAQADSNGRKKDAVRAVRDRWGNSPSQDADREGHAECKDLLG